jgi:glycosyltransferase involved in cell wall biosynthesis
MKMGKSHPYHSSRFVEYGELLLAGILLVGMVAVCCCELLWLRIRRIAVRSGTNKVNDRSTIEEAAYERRNQRARVTHHTLSVVICTKGRPTHLAWTIKSLLEQQRQPDELVIVDDGGDLPGNPEWYSYGRTMRAVKSRNFLYINKSDDPGLGKSRKIGFERSTGDIILYLDDDVTLSPRYISVLMRGFEHEFRTGVVGERGYETAKAGGATGNLIDPRPSWLKMFVLWLFGMDVLDRDLSSGRMLRSFIGVLVRKRPRYDRRTCFRPVEWLAGCNMAYRREALVLQNGWLLLGGMMEITHHRAGRGGANNEKRGYDETYWNYMHWKLFFGGRGLLYRLAIWRVMVGYVVINALRLEFRRVRGNLKGIVRIFV